MGALSGLPDFGARQTSGALQIYRSFEQGPYLLWPSQLTVATLASGRPDFTLLMVRAAQAGASYGVLDVGIACATEIDGALAFLRAADPKATVAIVPFQSGFMRLVAGPNAAGLSPELAQPSALGWGGVNATRWNIQLSSDAASIVKAGLTSTLPIQAHADVEVLGIAPRLSCVAIFDPAALIGGLLPVNASRQISRAVLHDYFMDAPDNLPSLRLEGNLPDRETFAEAMADRIRMQFGQLVPSAAGEDGARIEIATDIPSGIFRWNLADAISVLRPWSFTMDPFAAARALASTVGVDALCRDVTTSASPLGFFDIDVQAFLPPCRQGLLDLGVILEVPARPPRQPQADTHTLSFQQPSPPPDDHAVVHLRMSSLADLSYTVRTYAEIIEGATFRRMESPRSAETSPTLRLQPRDFPVDLVELSVDPALAAAASLAGTLTYTAPGGAPVETRFILTAVQLRAAIAVPRDVVSASMTIDAQTTSADGSVPLRLGPLPAAAQHFTLGSFEQYGNHTVAIDCMFDAAAIAVFGIELLGEGHAEDDPGFTTLYFTRQSSTATWTYGASSPFRAGYRWRVPGSSAWSAVVPYDHALHLVAPAGATLKKIWDVGGVHAYLRSDDLPGQVRYVPGDPEPQVDDKGRPALTWVDTGQVAVLALGTCLAMSEKTRNDLEVQIVKDLPAVERVDFLPADFTVNVATLTLTDGTGLDQTLATTPSFGAPPYNATFSVQLHGDQRARAITALGGAPNLLKVAYTLTYSTELASTFDGLTGSRAHSTDVGHWFSGTNAPTSILPSEIT